ncbi:hypothetical protein [Deinococcus soli (ex Cha et al. 2016)]|uniref:hypothetical protein n=1 Tax=Deinococcus soli (ex Cha et al. 2016) TaxID=1309411 RepID=UPI0016681499|nr:hypothetical protein [Deinococcus soli (ex Cha et al. 2016)]
MTADVSPTPTLDAQAAHLSAALGIMAPAARTALLALLGRLTHATLRDLRIEAALEARADLSSEPARRPA